MNSWQDSAKLDQIVWLLSAICKEQCKQTALLCAVHGKDVVEEDFGRAFRVVDRKVVDE